MRWHRLLFAVLACVAAVPDPSFAQATTRVSATGAVAGRIVDAQGAGVPMAVVLLSPAFDGAGPAELTAAADGTFNAAGLTPGLWTLSSRSRDGLAEAQVTIDILPDLVHRVVVEQRIVLSEQVTVTDAGSARLVRETPATVGTVSGAALAEARPSHPGEIMGQIPGVWVNITGGEGHQTAIRQPLTTNPVYLYLEDGVPTRSTGFFNHNALYEINVPAAEGIEVTKGPGSALYGSDAIGGVVNVVTRSSLARSGIDATLEAGGSGWRRLLAGGNWSNGTSGLRGTVNLTTSDGWREATGYERQGGTLRWDRARTGSLLKALVSVNRIDQQTAGSSSLPEVDYLASPGANLTPISFRNVQAYRASIDYQRAGDRTSWSLVPYFRYDSMDLLANWSLTYDPTVYTTTNTSYGVLARVQREMAPWRTMVLAGIDVDYSPGDHVEDIVIPGMTASGLPSGRPVFSSYVTGGRIYDYGVAFLAVSPYAQVEFSPVARVRVTAGLRADRMGYDYDDRLGTPDTPRHRRPADATRNFTHVTPKIGATWQVTDRTNVFASYRHAFRAPSEGQLFRQGSAANTIDLAPVRADNFEVGTRLRVRRGMAVDVSLYQLDKRDDILSFRDPVDGSTEAVNAGRTQHRGVEVGVDAAFGPRAGMRLSYAHARHHYRDWVVDPLAGIDYSGFEQEIAPRHMGTISAFVTPIASLRAGLDLTYLGPYWLDAANTTRYGGHSLVNVRVQYELSAGARVFARVINLADRAYAESGGFTLQRGREFAPGRPRTVFAGIEFNWTSGPSAAGTGP